MPGRYTIGFRDALDPMKDLASKITAFVLTIGDAENFNDCMAHLERQTVRFSLEVIDRVAPLSAALQEMIHRCRTPYYIEVDEDMLLFPHAVESLHEHITAAPPRVAIVSAPLWDCDIGRPLYGVKVHRLDIVRQFPYEDTHSADKSQINRLKAAGYEITNPPLKDRDACLGEHGKHYTPRTIYLRWRRLFQKRRLDGAHRGRGVPEPAFFLDRFVRDPQPLHLYSLLGVVAGLAGKLPPDREVDYRDPCPDFDLLAEALASINRDHQPARNPAPSSSGSTPAAGH